MLYNTNETGRKVLDIILEQTSHVDDLRNSYGWSEEEILNMKLSDLQIDSVDIIEIVFGIEDKFNVLIDETTTEKFYNMTLKEIECYVENLEK